MFGKTLMIDMYGCADGVCDDLELHYRFLEELVHVLDMKPMTTPFVVHAPVIFEPCDKQYSETGYFKREVFPDKAGVSAWIGLATSGCSIHSIEPSHFSSLDVYSCKDFDEQFIIDFAKKYFKFKDCEINVVKRGSKYLHPTD